ncbi:MAG: sodium:proton antiporter [Lachnospiraceae bacterium]|nr:sodium:proton antiporter [Lachnospiraceae bacterium]
MSFCLNFPLFLIVLSLISAVLCIILPGKAARYVALSLALLSAVLNAVILFYVYPRNISVTYLMGHYPHPWGNELRISAMEALFSSAFSAILVLCLLGGSAQLREKVQAELSPYFYVMTCLIQAALLALVYTNDVFTGYVFIEICTLSSCGILMIRKNGRTTLASVRYMIFSLVGSGLFLFGVIFLYNITGELLMPNIRAAVLTLWTSGEYKVPLLTAMCLMTLGLSIKSGLFPFHIWMADTYGTAIPGASAILSGLISKGYIFFLIKLIFDVFGVDVFYASGIHNVLFVFGVIGIIIGSVSAIRENNILRMIAFSSAAQIGYVYMGIGMSAGAGITAALFQMLTHAATKPALFLSAGTMTNAMGNAKKFRNLQGAGYVTPVAGLAFTFESFSMIGVPLTMGFMCKYLFGTAAFEAAPLKMIPTLIALSVSTILNTMYFSRTVIRIYRHPIANGHEREKTRVSYALAAVVFIVVNLFFGVFGKSFIDALGNCVTIF